MSTPSKEAIEAAEQLWGDGFLVDPEGSENGVLGIDELQLEAANYIQSAIDKATEPGLSLARLLRDRYWAKTPVDVARLADVVLGLDQVTVDWAQSRTAQSKELECSHCHEHFTVKSNYIEGESCPVCYDAESKLVLISALAQVKEEK